MRGGASVWIVLLLGSACGEAGSGGAPSSGGVAPWFVEVTGDMGLDFVHDAGGRGSFWLPEIMGGGLALFDLDRDGDLDLYLVDGNHELPGVEPGREPTNRLYRLEADGRYADVTQGSGLDDGGYGMGVAVGDVDNDGWPDVYVTNYGPNALYRNDGDGTFARTADPDTAVGGFSSSAGFLDYDRDGFLDLFVVQYVRFDASKECFDPAGRRDYCSPVAFRPEPDVLLHGQDGRSFADVSEPAGIGALAAAGLGVAFDDFDDDGWIDVYVANDAYENHLWRNRIGHSFEEVALVEGAAVNLLGQTEAGMGVVSADFDRDLDPDLFVTHLAAESNTLYRLLSPGVFTDDTGPSGLERPSIPYTGFGVAAFDFELDGDLDLFVANGRVTRAEPRPSALVPAPWNGYAEPNLAHLNDGTGRFTPLGPAGAGLETTVEISRGTAVGDLDGDGDLDLVVSNVQGPARIYRNEAPRKGNWLILSVRDEALHRDAYGARVLVTAGSSTWRAVVGSTMGYLSASDPRVHLGLGRNETYERVEVRWPDGTRERFAGGPTDRVVTIVEGTGEPIQ